MTYKKYVKSLFVILLSTFMSACIHSNAPNDPLPKDQKAELYLQMGVRYMEMGMLQAAMDNLQIAEKSDPNNVGIHNSLGALYERLKMLPEAKKQYQIAVNLDQRDFSVKNNYGRFLCERGDYEQGVELLNSALMAPLNNRRWFAYTNIARCELREGAVDEAELNLRRALQLNKNYSPALFEMQKISYHSAKYMSARAFLQRYLGVAKHNADTLWYAVQTERALGNVRVADDYKNKLFSLFPLSKQAQQLGIKN